MNILPLSKSTYQDFEKCPHYAYNRKVKGLRPPVGDAAKKGVQFHNAVANLLDGTTEDDVRRSITYPEVNEWLTLLMVNRKLTPLKKASKEAKILATRNLELCVNGQSADLIGIMDVVYYDEAADSLHIIDWKTGRYENDSEVERHLYAALGKALYPNVRNIYFELYFVQTNRSLMSTYSWASKDKVMVIKPPNGEISITKETINPMLFWVSDIIEKVESSDGSPKPGAQCRNWYGTECFFLREHCSAYKNGRKIRNA